MEDQRDKDGICYAADVGEKEVCKTYDRIKSIYEDYQTKYQTSLNYNSTKDDRFG